MARKGVSVSSGQSLERRSVMGSTRTERRRQTPPVASLLMLMLLICGRRTGRGMDGEGRGEGASPSATSYKRLTFVLNVNPIVEGEVREQTHIIARELDLLSPDEGTRYRKRVEAALARMAALGGVGGGTENATDHEQARIAREAGRREIFAASTEAVARVVVLRLAAVREAGRGFAAQEARRTWLAFAREVELTDPAAFASIARAWHAIGVSPARPEDERAGETREGLRAADGADALRRSERIDTTASVDTIIRYVTESYGPGFEPPPAGRLVPLPTRSPTYDARRQIPVALPPGASIATQIPRPRQILNMVARGVDERDTILIALGDLAFNTPYIFGEPSRSLGMSCNSCHNQGVTNPDLFVPGLSSRRGGMDVSNGFLAPHANNGHFDPVDTPDLRGIRYTAPYGRNGRFASLREFTRNGIMHEFNGPEPDPLILDGLIAYMNEFDLLPNPSLAGDGTLTQRTSAAARRGEEIFRRPFAGLDGRSCATCHVPSDQFLDRGRHDIGTGRPSAEGSRDGALDTPTLLGVKFTAPYFHDGSQATLQDVSEWFNQHFGLGLDAGEVADLTAYVETVGDGVDPYEETSDCLEAELRECVFFLSTYEFLSEREKPELVDIVFQTVGEIIRTHRALLQDPAYTPVLDRLAWLMDKARAANEEGDRATTDASVAAYRRLYEANREHLR